MYKVKIKDIQSKYTFKIFCAGADTSGIEQEIGDLSSLTTTTKTDLVSAINEVDGNTTTNSTAITNLQNNKEDKSNKTTTLSSSSTNTQYPSAKCVYDSQVAQDTVIDQTKEELDYYKTIYNVLPKVNGNGESITLDNTGESILKLDTRGQCKQDSTTGINQVGLQPLSSTTTSGLTYSVEGDILSINGTASAKVDIQQMLFNLTQNTSKTLKFYLISGTFTEGAIGIHLNESQYTQVSFIQVRYNDTNLITTKTIDLTNVNYVWLYAISGSVFNNAKFRVMLSDNASDTYEPYTGGQPSPSPDFPQQIHEVSGDNTIEVVGKNIFDESSVTFTTGILDDNGQPTGSTSSKYTNNFYPVQPNTDYTISGTLATTGSYRLYYYDKNKNWISRTDGQTASPKTYTTPNNCYYVRIQVTVAITLQTGDVMLEQSSSKTDYEPYNGDTYELSLGDIKMRGIGTYEDYFVRNSGKNLFDVKAFENQLVTGKIIDDNGNEVSDTTSEYSTYKIFLKANETIHIEGWFQRVYYYDENGIFKSRSASGGTSKMSSTYTPTTNEYIAFQIRTDVYPQNKGREVINKGNATLPMYEPYGTGQWCKYNAIGEEIFNGSESWIADTSGGYATNPYFKTSNSKFMATYQNIKSNYFIGKNISATTTGGIQKSANLLILQPSNGILTASDFKTWLATHNTKAVAPLITPYLSLIESETLQSQLDAIEKALGKDGQTNISQNNNDAPFKIYASALMKISGE